MLRYQCIMRNIYDGLTISFTLQIKKSSDLIEYCYNYLLDICRDKIIDYKLDHRMISKNDDLVQLKLRCISLEEIKEVYTITNLKKLSKCEGCVNKAGDQFEHMECSSGCLHDPQFCDYCSQFA